MYKKYTLKEEVTDLNLTACIKELLRPVVRLCIQNAIKLTDLDLILKSLFVEEAQKILKVSNSPESVSRLSVMTGLQRPIVSQIKNQQISNGNSTASLYQKVIGAWQTIQKYCTKAGVPRVLKVEGKQSEFAQLVKSVSKDTNPYTVLFELERSGVVQRTGKGVKLVKSSLISGRDKSLGLQYLAHDLDDLVSVAAQNIFEDLREPNHHLTTEYDSIPADKYRHMQTMLLEEGNRIHKKIRQMIAGFDSEIANQRAPKDKIRVSFTSFSRIQFLRKES